eukprot:551351_1
MSWLLQLIHVYRPTLLLVSLVNAFLIIGCFWEVNRSMNFDEIIHENVLKCFLFLFETRTNGKSHQIILKDIPRAIRQNVTKYRNEVCVICQNKFVDESETEQFISFGVLSCGHWFHKSCLSKWESQSFTNNPMDLYRCSICKHAYRNENRWYCKCDIRCVSKEYVDMLI